MNKTPSSTNEDLFAGSTAKIERSITLLKELEKEISAFAETSPVKIKIVTSEDQRTFEMNFDVTGVPPHISTIFGDIIHNLRSSLDMGAGEIVVAAGKSGNRVYFPFSNEEHDLTKMMKDKNFVRAGPMAVALLRSLRPYRGGNEALRAIHDLDIQDKHRKLIPIAHAFFSPVLRLWDDQGFPNIGIVGDETISKYRLVFPPDCELSGQEVLPTFERLVQLVNGIIGSFRELAADPLFPGA